ncbi:MpaA3 family daptide-type RiPP [Microbacterium sp. SA39]|nr:hypothetical protein RS85_02238 [Microbacterium sp. SA39]
MHTKSLEFIELEQIDAPLEWWEHASYIIGIAVVAAGIAT